MHPPMIALSIFLIPSIPEPYHVSSARAQLHLVVARRLDKRLGRSDEDLFEALSLDPSLPERSHLGPNLLASKLALERVDALGRGWTGGNGDQSGEPGDEVKVRE
jgi:hypothetical protein